LLKQYADYRADISDAGCNDFVSRRNASRSHRDVQGRAAGGTWLDKLVRVELLKPFSQQRGLLVLPVIKRVLLDRFAQLLQFRFTPALWLGHCTRRRLRSALRSQLVRVRFRSRQLAGDQGSRSGGDELSSGKILIAAHGRIVSP